MGTWACELCNNHPTLYCASDSAFLCVTCDAKVHRANFLVARHLRTPLCSHCNAFSEYFFSGSEIRNPHTVCRSCSAVQQLRSHSSSSSSTCVSSSGSISNAPTKNELDDRPKDDASSIIKKLGLNRIPRQLNRTAKVSMEWKVRKVFESWCKKMGLDNWKPIVTVATETLRVCMGRLAVLPLRVTLAASLWSGVRYSGERSRGRFQKLKRLEEISGVAAKVIVVSERKVSVVRRRELKEGWAECSV